MLTSYNTICNISYGLWSKRPGTYFFPLLPARLHTHTHTQFYLFLFFPPYCCTASMGVSYFASTFQWPGQRLFSETMILKKEAYLSLTHLCSLSSKGNTLTDACSQLFFCLIQTSPVNNYGIKWDGAKFQYKSSIVKASNN